MDIILIAVALALDASGVSMGVACGTKLNMKNRISLILSFGFFQFLLALSGALLGNFINTRIIRISDIASGVIIFIIGIILFREGFKREEECIYRRLTFWTVAILGISVSIDALGIGFSIMHKEMFLNMLNKSLIIGIVAAIFTMFSLYIIRYLKKIIIIEKYSDFIAGIILIIFGINMIL
ncbi:MAG TPA: manganese efflux pump [Halanaerobiales bacterium]|nr:manganese efflux pump [Halanaerobiales bacterium]